MGAVQIEDTISRLENLMYGYNYQVTFGLEILENCSNLDDFKNELKRLYKDSRPEKIQPIRITESDFWEGIDYALNYRGDSNAGLSLSENQEGDLEKEKAKYKAFIQQCIDKETEIFSYPDEEGIPAYAVFWDFEVVRFRFTVD